MICMLPSFLMITYETRDKLFFPTCFYISYNIVIHMNIQYDCLAELFGSKCCLTTKMVQFRSLVLAFLMQLF